MTRFVLAALAAAALAAAPAPAPARAADSAATAPTRTVRAGDATIGYRTVGRGRPVVLIMGLSGTMDGWDPEWVDALAAAGHRVVLFDNEGIGRSTARPGTLSIRRMGDNAAALIRALKLRRPDVVGWSMGGMIAQSLAVRHPRALRRLVLLATAPGDGKATFPTPEALALLTGSGAAGVDVLFGPGQTAARERFVRNVAKRRGLKVRAPGAVVRRQVAASGVWLTGGDPDGRRVARLKLPVLVGGGEQDPMLPFPNQQHLARVIPHAKLVAYRDAAHGFFLQHRTDFGARLRAFLRP